jgi:transposase
LLLDPIAKTKSLVVGALEKVGIPPLLRDFQAEWESPAVGLFRGAAFSTALLTHKYCYTAIFCNAARNRLKLLVWDGSGLWICAKKLSRGRFCWPEPPAGEVKVVLSHEELAMLLAGIDLTQARRRPWYRSQMDNDEVDSDRMNAAQNDCIPQPTSATK